MRSKRDMPRTATLGVLLLITAFVAAGCAPLFQQTVRGSGQIEERDVVLGDVTEVSIGSALNAEVVPGEDASVTVRADDNVMNRIEVDERGRRVEIRLERGIRLRAATVEIVVALPDLTRVGASGAADVEVAEGFDARELRVSASGASDVRGVIEAAGLDVSASGSSNVTLSGDAERLQARASGASDVDLRQLSVDGDARVEASGTSDVAVRVAGALEARASGASGVRYAGSPGDLTTQISGASSVEGD